MYSKTFTTAIAATLFASASAHFFISQPIPIPGSAPKDPLDASGSNFPCHGADLSAGTSTPMSAGSSQPIKFELGAGANTAVHGGGSCQISLTYETDPTKQKDPANWKVIQSFVGGCPTNAPGNLQSAVACPDSNPGCTTGVNQDLSFKIPAEVQNGDAILAWTWFNNIGNREMYMNCAKVSLTGGSGKLDSLPGMAVANLASVNQCKTTEQFNTGFQNPGQYVTTDSTLNYPIKAMQGSGCGAAASSGSSGSSGSTGGSAGSPPSGSTATSSASSGAYTPSTGSGSASGPSGGQSGSNQGGVFAPGAASAAPVASPTATQIATTFITAAAPAATPPSAPAAGSSPAAGYGSSPAAGSSSGSSGGGMIGQCSAGQVQCSTPGFYCIDAMTYGECAWGCATPMPVAAGTNCGATGLVHAVVPSRRRRRSSSHLHARAHIISPA